MVVDLDFRKLTSLKIQLFYNYNRLYTPSSRLIIPPKTDTFPVLNQNVAMEHLNCLNSDQAFYRLLESHSDSYYTKKGFIAGKLSIMAAAHKVPGK